jgi:cyclic pyranopterin phosphate synthase
MRMTGGEPLVRKNILGLVKEVGSFSLQDFAIKKYGSQLPSVFRHRPVRLTAG